MITREMEDKFIKKSIKEILHRKKIGESLYRESKLKIEHDSHFGMHGVPK